MEAMQNTDSTSLKSTLKTLSSGEKILLKTIIEFNRTIWLQGIFTTVSVKKHRRVMLPSTEY